MAFTYTPSMADPNRFVEPFTDRFCTALLYPGEHQVFARNPQYNTQQALDFVATYVNEKHNGAFIEINPEEEGEQSAFLTASWPGHAYGHVTMPEYAKVIGAGSDTAGFDALPEIPWYSSFEYKSLLPYAILRLREIAYNVMSNNGDTVSMMYVQSRGNLVRWRLEGMGASLVFFSAVDV